MSDPHLTSDALERHIRVLCVDDSNDILRLVQTWLALEDDIEVVGALRDPGSLIEEMARCTPDVVVMDMLMPGVDTIEFVRMVAGAYNTCRVLVYSGYDQPNTVRAALDAGAAGYVAKSREMDVLVDAIRRVARGELVTQVG